MTVLQFDQVGTRLYETGVDKGVLYIPDGTGAYVNGYAWNGLTTVTESPDGAEANPQYADNIKYLNLLSVETFGGTIEAFTYPPQFAQCDGTAIPQTGVNVGQQPRKSFGFSYRTRLGNDVLAEAYGYKLHLVYGALASPSEKAYGTINDSPDPIAFSWDFTTTAVAVSGAQPTSLITIDSSLVGASALTALENLLYGTDGTNARLPLPDEVIALFAGAITSATPTKPAWTAATHTITIPTVTGIKYVNDATGVTLAPGALVLTTGQSIIVRAQALPTYAIPAGVDTDWQYNYADT